MQFIAITGTDNPEQKIYKEHIEQLYLTAFPECERKPLSLIYEKQLINQTDILYFVEDGEFVGFAITMNDQDLVLLDYFAISDSYRGKGLGTNALQKLYRHYSDKRFFLEIESTFEDAPNIKQRIQRKQFYLRNDLTELGILADVFGTPMELLGHNMSLTYDEYYAIYVHIYGAERGGKIIHPIKFKP